MYFIISMILFITSIILYKQTGDFNQFWKLLLISGLFGLCDSISSLSIKRFIDTIVNYKPLKKDEKE